MKRILITALALLILVGCGSKTPEETGEVTITMLHNQDFITIPEAVEFAVERLNQRYADEGRDLKVTLQVDKQKIDWGEYHNNLMFAHKSNDAPDIFTADDDFISHVKAGNLMDLSEYVSDEFIEGAFTPSTIDGKNYAIPMDLPLRVIYYSKSSLEKIGWTQAQIDALPGQIQSGDVTLEDFMAIAKETVDKGASKYGVVHRPGAGSDFFDILNALGGEYFEENGTLVLDKQGLLKFFESINENANITKTTPNNLNQLGWGTINQIVGTGEAFAYYGPMYSASYVASAADLDVETFANNEEFVLFPIAAGVDKKPFATAAPQYVAASAKKKHPEIVKDILNELVNNSDEAMAKHADKILTLSSIKRVNDSDIIKANPLLKDAVYMQDYAQFVPSIQGLSTFRNQLFTQINSIELGQITPEEALKELVTQIELNVDNVIVK